MQFTPGQRTFALIFLCLFVLAMIFAYWRDSKTNRIHYKHAWKILAAIILIIIAIVLFLKANK